MSALKMGTIQLSARQQRLPRSLRRKRTLETVEHFHQLRMALSVRVLDPSIPPRQPHIIIDRLSLMLAYDRPTHRRLNLYSLTPDTSIPIRCIPRSSCGGSKRGWKPPALIADQYLFRFD